MIERMNNDEGCVEFEVLDNELKTIWEELSPTTRISSECEVKSKVNEFKEKKKNKKICPKKKKKMRKEN